MKVQAHSNLEPPLEYSQGQTDLKIKVRYDILTILGVTEILWSFRLVTEEKTGKGIPESSRVLKSKQFCFIRSRRQHLWTDEQNKYCIC